MTLTNCTLSGSLFLLSKQFIENYQQRFNHLPLVEQDEQWPSTCIQSSFDETRDQWQPVKVTEPLLFDNIEQALDITIHADIKSYFSTFYSESIDVECSEGNLSLLFAWNQEDFQRLQENMIGHILMKQKLKQEITLFFAVTDEDDTILSIINDTGEVWVEQVGCKPHKKVADSLTEFITQLTPVINA